MVANPMRAKRVQAKSFMRISVRKEKVTGATSTGRVSLADT
jgi:hypothetical protein